MELISSAAKLKIAVHLTRNPMVVLASIPGHTSLREVGLVSTVCACANIPPIPGGFG